MLPQAKIDELYDKLMDGIGLEGLLTDEQESHLVDAIDDALHDAYGSGELDERTAVLKYIATCNIPHTDGSIGTIITTARMGTLAEAIALGKHTPPDAAHLERCRKLGGTP